MSYKFLMNKINFTQIIITFFYFDYLEILLILIQKSTFLIHLSQKKKKSLGFHLCIILIPLFSDLT